MQKIAKGTDERAALRRRLLVKKFTEADNEDGPFGSKIRVVPRMLFAPMPQFCMMRADEGDTGLFYISSRRARK